MKTTTQLTFAFASSLFAFSSFGRVDASWEWETPVASPVEAPISPDDSVSVPLPPGPLGRFFTGETQAVLSVAGLNLFDDVPVGFVVDTITLQNGNRFSGLDAEEVREVLRDTSEERGRTMSFANPDPLVPLGTVVYVYLPAGNIGATFRGTPPTLTDVENWSALNGKVPVGFDVDTITLPNGNTHYGMSTREFTSVLRASSRAEGRMVRFVDLEYVELTPEPASPPAAQNNDNNAT